MTNSQITQAWRVLRVTFGSVGSFDVAVRDVAMAAGAWTLAQLTKALEPVPHRLASTATADPVHL